MADKRRRLLKRTALRLEQNQSHPLFVFSLTAEEITAVAEISRLSRSDKGKLLGYQRGEVRRHGPGYRGISHLEYRRHSVS